MLICTQSIHSSHFLCLRNLLASFAVVFILLNQWSTTRSLQIFDHEQLVRSTWPWAYTTLCFSCGYFAYDQLDMLKYGLYTGWFPSILAHHLILLICFTLALYRNVTINYLILTLICEVLSSCFVYVFVNGLSLLKFSNVSHIIYERDSQHRKSIETAMSLFQE